MRAAASHDLIIQKLVSHSVQKGVKHACVIAAEATYYEGYGQYIKELSIKSGQSVTYVSVPMSNTGDYRDTATRFKAAGCDAIYTWVGFGSIGNFYRRVRESGSKALVYGLVQTDDPGILKAAGKPSEGVVFARFKMGSQEFQDKYFKIFREQPTRPAIPAYDGVKLLLRLVEKVGTDADALKKETTLVKDAPATNGTLTYSSNGERLGEEIELMEIKNGTAVQITEF